MVESSWTTLLSTARLDAVEKNEMMDTTVIICMVNVVQKVYRGSTVVSEEMVCNVERRCVVMIVMIFFFCLMVVEVLTFERLGEGDALYLSMEDPYTQRFRKNSRLLRWPRIRRLESKSWFKLKTQQKQTSSFGEKAEAEGTAVQARRFYFAERVRPTLSSSDESLSGTRPYYGTADATGFRCGDWKGVGWKVSFLSRSSIFVPK